MSGGDFIKGLGIGMAIGAIVGMAFAPSKKTMKTTCGKTIKTIGSIVENVSRIFG